MSSYLLEEDDGREERIGYLYLEFKRQDSDTYLTIGMGIRARRGKNLDKWYFSLTDGRRIGTDFYLYKDTGEKVTLSKKELENKITRAEFDREAARSAVEHMEELGLLNDEDYARRLANELFTRKKFGARRVKQELRQKGIDDALIAAVMDEFSTERSETEENIRAILERKYPMAREDEKVRRRAVAALQRYGYGFDEIFSVLNSEE